MTRTFYIALLFFAFPVLAQEIAPELSVWKIADGTTGKYYTTEGNIIDTGIEADVQSVHYTCDSVYISATGVPSYLTGPFLDGNPGVPDNQNWLFRINRKPIQETGTQTEVPLGAIGVLINGTLFENYSDAMSWDNAGVWWRNANVWELDGFDCARGHPQGTAYHHHQNPVAFSDSDNPESDICDQFPSEGLYSVDPTVHSPLIGYAFDGYPLYGPYGYADAMDNQSGLLRIKSSYDLRDITERTTYADGSSVTPGPALEFFPLGSFREDFEYTGNGDVDEHNGRWCVTPEYPCGTYAYFATQDAQGHAAYPFFIGPTYYGVVDDCNFTIGAGGPGGGPGGMNPPPCDEVPPGSPCCGDGICGGPENATNCPDDCGGLTGHGPVEAVPEIVSNTEVITLPAEAVLFSGSCNLEWSYDPQNVICDGDDFKVNIETELTISDACLDNISISDNILSITGAALGSTISFTLSNGDCCTETVSITLPDSCGEADCLGASGGSALPGTPCDDNDESTGDDTFQDDCSCLGLLLDCEGVAGGSALEGTSCDDNDPATLHDAYQADCTCIGQVIDCEGTPNGTLLPGTPCDDGDMETENDVYQIDCTCLGEANIPPDCLGEIGGPAIPGSPCDDLNSETQNDVYQSDCTCLGQIISGTDCQGLEGGPDIPGQPCDDEDPNTFNDIWQFDCECAGSIFECEFLALNIGDPCNDFNPLTSDDIVMDNCVCVGAPIDCEGTSEGSALPFSPCDDGDANTAGDVWNDDCICEGFSVGIEDVFADMVFYPNPVNDFLQVDAALAIERYMLTNIQGQMVLSLSIDGLEKFEVDMAGFESGIYFLSIFNEGSFVTQKILKN